MAIEEAVLREIEGAKVLKFSHGSSSDMIVVSTTGGSSATPVIDFLAQRGIPIIKTTFQSGKLVIKIPPNAIVASQTWTADPYVPGHAVDEPAATQRERYGLVTDKAWQKMTSEEQLQFIAKYGTKAEQQQAVTVLKEYRKVKNQQALDVWWRQKQQEKADTAYREYRKRKLEEVKAYEEAQQPPTYGPLGSTVRNFIKVPEAAPIQLGKEGQTAAERFVTSYPSALVETGKGVASGLVYGIPDLIDWSIIELPKILVTPVDQLGSQLRAGASATYGAAYASGAYAAQSMTAGPKLVSKAELEMVGKDLAGFGRTAGYLGGSVFATWGATKGIRTGLEHLKTTRTVSLARTFVIDKLHLEKGTIHFTETGAIAVTKHGRTTYKSFYRGMGATGELGKPVMHVSPTGKAVTIKGAGAGAGMVRTEIRVPRAWGLLGTKTKVVMTPVKDLFIYHPKTLGGWTPSRFVSVIKGKKAVGTAITKTIERTPWWSKYVSLSTSAKRKFSAELGILSDKIKKGTGLGTKIKVGGPGKPPAVTQSVTAETSTKEAMARLHEEMIKATPKTRSGIPATTIPKTTTKDYLKKTQMPIVSKIPKSDISLVSDQSVSQVRLQKPSTRQLYKKAPSYKEIVTPAFKPVSITSTKGKTATVSKTILKPVIKPVPTMRAPAKPGPFSFPPLTRGGHGFTVPAMSFKEGDRAFIGRFRKSKQPKGYSPSLTAAVFNIRGPRPMKLHGLEIRPLPEKKAKKKKKSAWDRWF